MMMEALFGSFLLLLVSGALALAFNRSPRASSIVGMLGPVASCALGLAPSLRTLFGGSTTSFRLPWASPYGEFVFGLDRLSSVFLVPLLVLAALAAVYSCDYLSAYWGRKWLGPFWFFFNLLVAGIVLILLARDALSFLVGWEMMTLSAFLLVTFDHEHAEVRRAGWIYLLAGHIGIILLFIIFLLLARRAENLEFGAFVAVARDIPPTLSLVVFALAVAGFGIKAGFVPFHVWLPEAHAAAPSHVSALMSGVLIKIGLYGFLRALTFLTPASWWGPALIALGLVSAVFGISQALYQRDLKRALAYSSIENIGLITMGFGLAYWGYAKDNPRLAALGLLAACLHLWNHAAMKGLLFLSAGSVLHGCGTKDLEMLGGLGKRMPYTATAFLIGALAVGGLPPLNGFVSEWFLYQALFAGGTGAPNIAALLLIGVLALVGGLAALCFVRLVGVALLGEPRSPGARHAHESSRWLLGPMYFLVAVSIGLAVWPQAALRPVAGLAGEWFDGSVAEEVLRRAGALSTIGACQVVIWTAIGVAGILFFRFTRRAALPVPTWDCGYAEPSVHMQYTAGSFAQLAAQRLLPAALTARAKGPELPASPFPPRGEFQTERLDPFTRSVFEPFFSRWAERFARLRWLQQGLLHIYVLYILMVTVTALLWALL